MSKVIWNEVTARQKVELLRGDGFKDYEIIDWFKAQPNWFAYDGDASCQAALWLPERKLMLRVGVTDDDVAETPGVWIDVYAGLF